MFNIKWREFLPKSLMLFEKGHFKSFFWNDFSSGLTVAIVALPLAMALAIASGVEPQRGLFTAIVAGVLVSLFGGSRVQIGGPTGAFVVIIYGIVAQHGYDGLALATLMAGGFLILMALFRLGTVIQFIPYPVVTGFTAGIALIIFSSQIKDFFGLAIEEVPADFFSKWVVYFQHIDQLSWITLLLGIFSLIAILLIEKYTPKIPAPIVVVVIGLLVVSLFNLPIETIESRFGSLPATLPAPSLPAWSFEKMQVLIPHAFTIALLAAIESLLCAVVADGMMGSKHNPNSELVGQGLANIGSILFGGIPATGAIARTATAIRAGGKTPLAGILHGLLIALFMFFLAGIIVKVPLTTLAAILIVVAWNMSQAKSFQSLLRAPPGDVAVLLVTFFLTVAVDLTIAVQVGVVFSALLFIRRISEVTQVGQLNLTNVDGLEDLDDPDGLARKEIPNGVEIYEINGPFFFGVADKLKSLLDSMGMIPQIFILRMRKVPVVDASGMFALEEFKRSCDKNNTILLLSGVSSDLQQSLEKFGFMEVLSKERIFNHIDHALTKSQHLLDEIAKEQNK